MIYPIQLFGNKLPAVIHKITCKLHNDLGKIRIGNRRRTLADDHHSAAKVLHTVACLVQKLKIIKYGRVFLLAEGDGNGSQKHLSFNFSVICSELFKQHTLVRGVLVDYQELFALLDQYIGFERFTDNSVRLRFGFNFFNLGSRLFRFRFGNGFFNRFDNGRLSRLNRLENRNKVGFFIFF